ncbi:hypothetical protein [Catellatospora sp. NPDC049609]|uniref:hypothetical protein n=1 Tax=Catellatospora sp. NPDC049609 TaxID=3155505 RepID=UPI00341F8881
MLDQIPALLGVVVGVGASYLATSLGDRRRAHREQAAKLDHTRQEAYAAYGRAVKDYVVLSARIVASRGVGNGREQPLDPAIGLPQLAELEATRTAVWEMVLLLGDTETIAAAREWHRCAWYLEWFARGEVAGDQEWDQARAEASAARDRFYACARRSLHVLDPLPEPLPAPAWMLPRSEPL